MLENPRREVGLKRNNNKLIYASIGRSHPQSNGEECINRQVPSSFGYTHSASAQV